MKIKGKNVSSIFILFLVALVLVPLGWLTALRMEGTPPDIRIDLPASAVGSSKGLSLTAADRQSGLRRVWVGLLKDGKELTLFEKDYPAGGLTARGKVLEDVVHIPFDPAKLGLGDGEAVLRMMARDYSWRDFFHGSKAYHEKRFLIDTRPPGIEVLSRVHNINMGGSGLVVYRLSEDCSRSGVMVGDRFFPGYPGHFKDGTIHMALVALGHDQNTDTLLSVIAEDHAGNSARSGFPYYLRKKRFRKDTLTISDRFLQRKMPAFADAFPESRDSLVELFLKVNREMRKDNTHILAELGERNTEARLLWEGPFIRLPNSARRAAFADHRTYRYHEKEVDRQVHLGIDLASTSAATVPAANNGRVIYTGDLGIYGKTVVIDHGFGLLSTYSHLSYIGVAVQQEVTRGESIGRTGATGMAGGDHLHLGMMVQHTFVNPVEWWDASWIRHNITDKLETLAGLDAS